MFKKKVFYWCPVISNVATINATINSINSLNKFSKNFEAKVIDTYGEWQKISIKRNINLEDVILFGKFNFIEAIPSEGFFFSRIKYLLIFFYSFYKLKNFLKKEKPEYLIIHLITSLPLLLNYIYNFNTRIILRISGKPKMNLFRLYLWKIALKNIFKVTFPTKETLEEFKKLNLVEEAKLELLYDPVLNLKDISSKKNEMISERFLQREKYFLSIGRLTKQKNFDFLINAYAKIFTINKGYKLIIIGEGEDRKKLQNIINNFNLQDYVHLIGFKDNIFKYFRNAECFILPSLWEDPGWVLIEAIASNTIVLSSDCPSGPKEILDNGKGILFKSNSEIDFIKKFQFFKNLDESKKKMIRLKSKLFIKQFSLLNHYKNLLTILSS
jgi:glycosyltransferase involved in cell wall biosynthesis